MDDVTQQLPYRAAPERQQSKGLHSPCRIGGPKARETEPGGGVGLARGHGVGLLACGGAYWPLPIAQSDPLWVRTCFGCVNEAPG